MTRFAAPLTERQIEILLAVVREHVRTGEPVGSQVVRDLYGVQASTATIRNEMMELEQAGYLRQPHTSAGRVPCDSAYRLYVNYLSACAPDEQPDRQTAGWIQGEYRRMASEPHELLRKTSRMLARLTSHPAVVTLPPAQEPTIASIRIQPVSATTVLLFFTTSDTREHHYLLRTAEPVTAAQLADLSQRSGCMRRVTLIAVALTCVLGCAFAQPGRLPATKKLIEYGWDVPTPEYVAANIREMEKRPFDGVIMRTQGKGRGNIFAGGKWDPKEYAGDMKAMSSIKWGKFKNNFLMMYSASEMDWFSDSDWDAVLSNVNLMAQLAKAGGCSLAFDAEPYGKNPWLWSEQKQGKTKTYAEYSAKARQRGKQFAEAIGKVLPDNVTLTFFTYSLFRAEMGMLDPARREQALAGHSYSLYVPFLNGYLEGMTPGMTLTDGNEPSYYYDNSEKFLDAFHMMRQSALSLVPKALAPKFQTQTQASQALYMDFVFARVPWKNIQALYLSPEEQAKWFEHNTYWALKTTDEYVWLYSEKMDWWKNTDVPPGMEQAIIKARAAIAENRPLGWDLKDLMQSVQDKRRAAIAERLIKRTAEIPALQGPAPKVDGVLDDAAWKDAAQLPNFVGYFGSTDDDIKAKTNAMVTYDQNNLYVAIKAEEPEVAQMQIMGTQHDDSVWMGDSLDLFLTPNLSGTPYYHFILSPSNVQWDAEFATDNDMSYDPKWQSATKVGEKQWVAEIAIPWSSLQTKPAPGLTLKANLTRQRKPGKGELSSWSQVLTGFMEPEQFGTWVLK